MGVYDTYGEIQLKVGPCRLFDFEVGDLVPLADGVYIGHEGAAVIVDGRLMVTFKDIITKWGESVKAASLLNIEDNPVWGAIAVQELMERREREE